MESDNAMAKSENSLPVMENHLLFFYIRHIIKIEYIRANKGGPSSISVITY